jgi:RNA polymerase sigma-70 factor (ECF subfamily)
MSLVASLPTDQAQAVVLRAVVGLDAATAGQVLGKRPGAVRVAAHRGLRTLARRLQEADGPARDDRVTDPVGTALEGSS